MKKYLYSTLGCYCLELYYLVRYFMLLCTYGDIMLMRGVIPGTF